MDGRSLQVTNIVPVVRVVEAKRVQIDELVDGSAVVGISVGIDSASVGLVSVQGVDLSVVLCVAVDLILNIVVYLSDVLVVGLLYLDVGGFVSLVFHLKFF